MRLTVPQIEDHPADLGYSVDRSLDGELVEEGFARVARVLNGGIGPENLAPGFVFGVVDFRESKDHFQLSAFYQWSGAPTEPTLLPLGTLYAAATLVTCRVVFIVGSLTPPVVRAYSAIDGAGAQVGPDLVGTLITDGPHYEDKYHTWIGVPAPCVWEYSLAGAYNIPVSRLIYLRLSGMTSPYWISATAQFTALHQA